MVDQQSSRTRPMSASTGALGRSLPLAFPSAGIRLILLNSRQHPVKLARSYFSAAEFADAGIVYLERSATIGAIQVGTCGHWFGLATANKGPILAPRPQLRF